MSLRRLFSFSSVLVAGLAVITCFTASTRFNDPDLWWHLRTGEIIWTTHSIPATDVFSFTTNNHAWTDHEWLAQLSIYGAWRLGGYAGLMAWMCVLGWLLFAAVYLLCRVQRCGPLVSFGGALVAWFFGTVSLAVRPLILGYLLLVVELLLLEAGRRGSRRWWWLLPPLFALWVNCHGSYFFGIGVLGVYWLCSYCRGAWGSVVAKPEDPGGRRALLWVLCGSAAALVVNPVGPRLLLYPIDALFLHPTGVNVVTEWMPPLMGETRTIAMLGLTAMVMLAIIVRRNEIELRQLALFGATFVLACQHARMSFLFGIVAAPVVAMVIEPWLGRDSERDHPIANAVLVAGCVAAVAAGFPSRASLEQQVRAASPAAAVEYLKGAGLAGPMLNEYVLGGYLIWAWREQKVFIDGRADVYEWTGVLQEYMRWATLSEDPAKLLDKYGIRLCLVTAASPMIQVMQYLPGWRRVYGDQVAVVFGR